MKKILFLVLFLVCLQSFSLNNPFKPLISSFDIIKNTSNSSDNIFIIAKGDKKYVLFYKQKYFQGDYLVGYGRIKKIGNHQFTVESSGVDRIVYAHKK